MRRSSKRPADFLKDLPPIPKFKFDVRIIQCLPESMNVYELGGLPCLSMLQDTNWRCQLQIKRMYFLEADTSESSMLTTSSSAEQNAASELHVLSTQWKELCQKNIEIRVVSSQIEDQIQDRRREAEKK
ncbi:pre-mRNA-splicing factor SPF27 homolog [Cucurbita moschata]|uniref:Pre-mRNA-splicing factor SPF27 homolog n=1 Tax=Cucurbita moschata TaxID=3662 RepID=A0A6J1GUT2_CUCMO|nr:pre-mRNA-splicing factor SPF27 homolog [Cucurbita moschata]